MGPGTLRKFEFNERGVGTEAGNSLISNKHSGAALYITRNVFTPMIHRACVLTTAEVIIANGM